MVVLRSNPSRPRARHIHSLAICQNRAPSSRLIFGLPRFFRTRSRAIPWRESGRAFWSLDCVQIWLDHMVWRAILHVELCKIPTDSLIDSLNRMIHAKKMAQLLVLFTFLDSRQTSRPQKRFFFDPQPFLRLVKTSCQSILLFLLPKLLILSTKQPRNLFLLPLTWPICLPRVGECTTAQIIVRPSLLSFLPTPPMIRPMLLRKTSRRTYPPTRLSRQSTSSSRSLQSLRSLSLKKILTALSYSQSKTMM